MATGRGRRVRSGVLIIALSGALAMAGCSSESATEATTDAGPSSSTTTPPATTATDPASARCTSEALLAAVRTAHAGAAVEDLTCGNRVAVLTVVGTTAHGPEAVAVYRLETGAWAEVAAGPVTSDASIIPKDVSSGIFTVWQSKHRTRTNPATTTTRRGSGPDGGGGSDVGGSGGGGATPVPVPGQPGCVRTGDYVDCTPTTTESPVLTFPAPTTAPTTTAPAVTTTARPPVSSWCQNPANALTGPCLQDPGYPGP